MKEDSFHLTEKEWAWLEPLLQKAEAHAHEEFFAGVAAKDLLRGDSKETPGGILLKYLKNRGDESAVRLFRAMELYQHEIVRHDIAAVYHLAKGDLKA